MRETVVHDTPREFIDAMDDIAVEVSLAMKRKGMRLCDLRDRMTVLVSDHAFVRWLERVHHLTRDLDHGLPAGACQGRRARYGCAILGISIDEARATICFERLDAGIAMGARAIRADGGLRFPIRGGVVVTCLTREMYG